MSAIDKIIDSISAAWSDLCGDHDKAKLMRGELDESPNGGDVIVMDEWPGRLRPRGSDYRVVRYQFGRLGLQSKVGEEWYDLLRYSDGLSDDGRLSAARWMKLADCCMYKIQELKFLREKLLGVVKAPEVLQD